MRSPPEGLVHHSDRSSQYYSIDYQAGLRRRGITISMSGKGNCYDNAMVETFFKTLKSELIWRPNFHTRADAEHAIARYIDGFYNPVRRHSALDYLSHVQFEKRAANRANASPLYRGKSRFLLVLSDNVSAELLTLIANVLAIIRACSQTERRAHTFCEQ
jgi:putative transposase